MQYASELPWLLVGGGLANCLLALRLEQLGLDYRLIERGPQLAGEHTWSCHETDFSAGDQEFIRPLADYAWPGYTVRFNSFERQLNTRYLTLRSAGLRKILNGIIPARKIILNTEVHKIGDHAAETNRGIFLAEHIVRADGFAEVTRASGYQKFVGWDIQFAHPHGLTRPLLMDATVEQTDGYRFFYLLPLDANTLLVEDTRYCNDAKISDGEFSSGIEAYVARAFPGNPWKILRSEKAALPIPLCGVAGESGFGVAGGFFHPTTGYSLPYAVRTSRELIEKVRAGATVAEALDRIRSAQQSTQNFYYLLNRMMFLAAPPRERFRIFERFYQLDEKLITRFYAGTSTFLDKARLLMGKPPVKIMGALKVLHPQSEVPAWT